MAESIYLYFHEGCMWNKVAIGNMSHLRGTGSDFFLFESFYFKLASKYWKVITLADLIVTFSTLFGGMALICIVNFIYLLFFFAFSS